MPIHHPHLFLPSTHHSQPSTTHFSCCPKKLQDTKIYREEIYFFHNLKTMHPFAKLFQGDMHIDDGNMLKQF